jgi:8-hydroxy-5-deazaflavin:NADPH oxidoreductase
MLTVPLKAVPDLARDLGSALSGKVVLDTGNAYERRDGEIARRASEHAAGSAGWAAAMFPEARWVKAFNTVNFKTLQSEAHRSGERLGIPLAGDDREALRIAADLVREAGFDPVIVGPLVRGRDFEPDSRPYDTGMSGSELRALFSQPA